MNCFYYFCFIIRVVRVWSQLPAFGSNSTPQLTISKISSWSPLNILTSNQPFHTNSSLPSQNLPGGFNVSQLQFLSEAVSSSVNTIHTVIQAIANASAEHTQPSLKTNSGGDATFSQLLDDTFRSCFENISRTANKTIMEGLKRLNETALSVFLLSQDLVTTSVQDIKNSISHYNETVRSCVYDHSSTFQEMISAAHAQALDCIQKKVEAAIQIWYETRRDNVLAATSFQKFIESINHCGSLKNPINCYIEALFNVNKETLLLFFQLARRVSVIEEYVGSVRTELINCTASITDSIATQSLNVSQTIASCLLTN